MGYLFWTMLFMVQNKWIAQILAALKYNGNFLTIIDAYRILL